MVVGVVSSVLFSVFFGVDVWCFYYYVLFFCVYIVDVCFVFEGFLVDVCFSFWSIVVVISGEWFWWQTSDVLDLLEPSQRALRACVSYPSR